MNKGNRISASELPNFVGKNVILRFHDRGKNYGLVIVTTYPEVEGVLRSIITEKPFTIEFEVNGKVVHVELSKIEGVYEVN